MIYEFQMWLADSADAAGFFKVRHAVHPGVAVWVSIESMAWWIAIQSILLGGAVSIAIWATRQKGIHAE